MYVIHIYIYIYIDRFIDIYIYIPRDENGEINNLIRHHLRRLFLGKEKRQKVSREDAAGRKQHVQHDVAKKIVHRNTIHPTH